MAGGHVQRSAAQLWSLIGPVGEGRAIVAPEWKSASQAARLGPLLVAASVSSW